MRELVRELRIQQARVARSAAVVQQTRDGRDAKLAQPREPLVRPAPVGRTVGIGHRALPQHRIAQRADAELGTAREIADARVMARALELAEIRIADAVVRRLDPAPQLETSMRA